jgi:aminopeptidase N
MDAQAASPELSKNIVPIAYRIVLTPDVATARFAGTEEIDVEVKQPTETVIVNAADLVISGAQLADDSKSQATISVDEKAETASLHFSHLLSAGRHTLALSYSGSIGTGGSGLFSVKYDTGQRQNHMLVTQFEFSSARRMLPCWDEPSAKATFTLSATLPANDAVISNTPVAVESAAGTDASGVPLKRTSDSFRRDL